MTKRIGDFWILVFASYTATLICAIPKIPRHATHIFLFIYLVLLVGVLSFSICAAYQTAKSIKRIRDSVRREEEKRLRYEVNLQANSFFRIMHCRVIRSKLQKEELSRDRDVEPSFYSHGL